LLGNIKPVAMFPNEKPGACSRTGLQDFRDTARQGFGEVFAGESSAALFLTSKLKAIGSQRPFRGAFCFGG
jgi:hypothetical protein